MILRATDMADLTVAVGEAAKEGTDLLDIVQLTLDRTAGPLSRSQLHSADTQLRQDAALHVQRWFLDHADRSLRLIRAIPEGRDTDIDDLHLVGELLRTSLTDSPQP